MGLKLGGPVEKSVYELMDVDGWKEWKKTCPEPDEAQTEAMLMRFFRKRDDMTPEDFYGGVDPLIEPEGG